MQRTDRVNSSISFVPTLHTRTYLPCKWEDMGMHTVATLVCHVKLGGKYRKNIGNAGQY